MQFVKPQLFTEAIDKIGARSPISALGLSMVPIKAISNVKPYSLLFAPLTRHEASVPV